MSGKHARKDKVLQPCVNGLPDLLPVSTYEEAETLKERKEGRKKGRKGGSEGGREGGREGR